MDYYDSPMHSDTTALLRSYHLQIALVPLGPPPGYVKHSAEMIKTVPPSHHVQQPTGAQQLVDPAGWKRRLPTSVAKPESIPLPRAACGLTTCFAVHSSSGLAVFESFSARMVSNSSSLSCICSAPETTKALQYAKHSRTGISRAEFHAAFFVTDDSSLFKLFFFFHMYENRV